MIRLAGFLGLLTLFKLKSNFFLLALRSPPSADATAGTNAVI